MVLSRFSAPLITLAPAPPPTCLFIPMTYSFKCNTDNFDKVRCNLQRIESEHKAGRERQRFWKWHKSRATRMKRMKGAQMLLAWQCWATVDCIILILLCLSTTKSGQKTFLFLSGLFVHPSHSCECDISGMSRRNSLHLKQKSTLTQGWNDWNLKIKVEGHFCLT